MINIDINDFDYDLPEDRIAQYPESERDASRLLVYKNGKETADIFRNISEYIPSGSLLIFNNTRVIRARILFNKSSGAAIEILCLEPQTPSDYSMSFASKEPVTWKCIVGNLKKWKSGGLITSFDYKGSKCTLCAEKIHSEGETCNIRFTWNNKEIAFGEVLEATGHIPLPPYINRADEEGDADRYQTLYSRIDGSVAAPTAGLHFTENVFEKLLTRGIKTAELTLHVGAGTFKPVKSSNVREHEMHCEHFSINKKTIEVILENIGRIIPVGTTSVRTIESLYWLGIRLIQKRKDIDSGFFVGQWEPYGINSLITTEDSLTALINYMNKEKLNYLQAATSIIIVPGYKFRVTNGIVTNFHQPRSTLLLLISAFTGEKWKELYIFALKNGFRFLSYGDSSLLLK